MIHEYALDPEVLGDWQSFRFFVDQFGVHTGRLISQYPKHWKRFVHLAVERSDAKPVQRLAMVERLNNMDDRLIRRSGAYDGTVTWVENALIEHATHPFQAVMAKALTKAIPGCLVADSVHAGEPLWNVPTQQVLEREPEILAAAASRLLNISSEIIFVDPHFKPGRPKWLRPLQEFIACAIETSPAVARLEYHFKYDPERSEPWDVRFEQECKRRLEPIIPKGMSLRLVRWKKRVEGKSLHARLLLTDRGGIGFDYGLDEGDELGDTTLVSLLDPAVYAEFWDDFQVKPDPAACTYELDGQLAVIGTLS